MGVAVEGRRPPYMDTDVVTDDVGFRWVVVGGATPASENCVVDTNTRPATFNPGDSVWVRLSGSRGRHGTVDKLLLADGSCGNNDGVGIEQSQLSADTSNREVDRPTRRRIQVDGKGRSRREILVNLDDDCEVVCGLDRLSHVVKATPEQPHVLVVAHTDGYRHLARCQVTPQDRVVEIGSSTGLCTTVLHSSAQMVVGFDVSLAHLAESRRKFPNISFHFLDIFEEPDRLRDMPEVAGASVAFVDINGDREISQVLHAVEILRRHCFLGLRLVVVKSEELHAAAAKWGFFCCSGGCAEICEEDDTGVRLLRDPLAFLEPWGHLRCPKAPIPRSERMRLEGAQDFIGSGLQRKKKKAHCSRASALEDSAPAACGRPTIQLGMLESSLPDCAITRFGFHCCSLPASLGALDGEHEELTICLVLNEEEHPLVRDHGVVCVFAGETLSERLARAARASSHCGAAMFVGRGGARAATYEYWGFVEFVSELPKDSPHYGDPGILAAWTSLAARSRQGLPTDARVHLYQFRSCKQPNAASSKEWPPDAPTQLDDPATLLDIVRQRRLHIDGQE